MDHRMTNPRHYCNRWDAKEAGCQATINITFHRIMQYEIWFDFSIESHKFKKQHQVVDRINAVSAHMMHWNMTRLPDHFSVGNIFVDRSQHDHFMPFRNEFTDDIQPEIVNIPGGVGDDQDFL